EPFSSPNLKMSKPAATAGSPAASAAPAPSTSSPTGTSLPSLSIIPTISVTSAASPSSPTASATQSSVDPTSTDGGSGSGSDSGGMSAGVMITGMMAATLAIVVFITFIVRRKMNVLRTSRRTSQKLYDTECNDIFAVGQPTYYEEKHGFNTRGSIIKGPNNNNFNQINRPDSIFVDPGHLNANHNTNTGNRVSFAPVSGQRLSIYRQSTGAMYEPPVSLMPVNGNFIPPSPV
ncbi:5607_t:CDS:2, partial [Ambispora leptoticha]